MFRLLVTIILAGLGAGAATAGDAPRWPLDLPTRYLTSNFMEYRPGRFHAGLDLKTRTISGFPAYAVEDGWIARVRATPTAYGRVVYLRGDSGRTYVYAHLSRFNDDLRARLAAQRQRTGTYRASLEFRPQAVRVRQGDVLGLTGESGTGGPHLHFEVRDAANRPIDPQAVGFAVGDTIAPVIHHLRAWPVTGESRLAGGPDEVALAAAAGLQGELAPLAVSGPVAFSARIVDASDIRGHRLEPAEIRLWLDGREVYACRNEGYDFAENALLRLEWVEIPGLRERWLHRHPANRLTGRTGDEWYLGGEGAGLAPGRHELRLRAADRAGNATEVRWALLVEPAPGPVPSPGPDGWRPSPVSPVIAAPDSSAVITVTPFFTRDDPAVAAAVPGLQRRVYTRQAGDPVQTDLVVYSRPVTLDEVRRRAAADQGLRPLGVAREFVAAAWPIEASLPADMAVPVGVRDEATWGLYRWDGAAWRRVETWPEARDGTAPVHLDRTGLHAALADLAPPVITVPAVPPVVRPTAPGGSPGVTLPRWEVLPVGVRDLGAGLAVETLRVRLDGTPLIVEPDLPRDRILVELPDGLAAGPHRLEIEVADEAGHGAAATVPFIARD